MKVVTKYTCSYCDLEFVREAACKAHEVEAHTFPLGIIGFSDVKIPDNLSSLNLSDAIAVASYTPSGEYPASLDILFDNGTVKRYYAEEAES